MKNQRSIKLTRSRKPETATRNLTLLFVLDSNHRVSYISSKIQNIKFTYNMYISVNRCVFWEEFEDISEFEADEYELQMRKLPAIIDLSEIQMANRYLRPGLEDESEINNITQLLFKSGKSCKIDMSFENFYKVFTEFGAGKFEFNLHSS